MYDLKSNFNFSEYLIAFRNINIKCYIADFERKSVFVKLLKNDKF